jgi:hypothetical protein
LSPKIGKSLSATLCLDHQWKNCPIENERKRLGLSLTITDEQINRETFLLGYDAMYSSKAEDSLPILQNILEVTKKTKIFYIKKSKDLNLWDLCQDGQIGCVSDMAAINLAKLISPNNYNTCAAHHYSNYIIHFMENLPGRSANQMNIAKQNIEKYEKKLNQGEFRK